MIKDVAFFSECGARNINQDAIFASARGNRGIFVVADGMGGHAEGEVASSAIVNGIRNWWNNNDFAEDEIGIDTVAEQCNSLLMNINFEVFSYFSAKNQMGGSTVVALIIWDDRYMILSAGDSRIYRSDGKSLSQLTTDDVWENLPEIRYKMSKEILVKDTRYGKLTEVLGSEERLKISRSGGMLAEKEVFLLCSDGVYRYCAQDELERILRRGMFFKSAERMKEMIKKSALKGGTDDNYSAIVCVVK